MKLLIQSAMIFFGTLMAAALVALGEPGTTDVEVGGSATPHVSVERDYRNVRNDHPWSVASMRGRFEPR